MKRKQHLGEMLVSEEIISREDLDSAIDEGLRNGKRLGHVLVENGYLSEEALAAFLEKQLGMPVIDINTEFELEPELLKIVPRKYCLENLVAPIKLDKNQLTIAMADPTNFSVVDEVRFMADAAVHVLLATENAIMIFLKERDMSHARRGRGREKQEDDSLSLDAPFAVEEADNINEKALAEMADDAPVVKWVNNLIVDAIARKASDIHIETYEESMRVLLRIDGMLEEMPDPPPRELQPAIISRIKIIARLDISERRLPQDGRIGLDFSGKKIDLRVSIVPGIHGENVVLRILDKSAELLDIANLGLGKKETEIVRKSISMPHGMVLVAGPTGSGKTTTLYAVLQHVRQFDKKILTIEDPVEYQLTGVTQVQTHADIGLDFARGLRSFLRHDPDVIMVGEIRDLETAEISIRSALTGHLVLSTVHTNDSPSAITRFIDMGIPPYLVTATFNLVVSQRLVRQICPHCKKRKKVTAKWAQEMGLKGRLRAGSYLYYGAGCKKCNETGYQGRFAVFEIMVINEKVRDLIVHNASLPELRDGAREAGMRSLLDHALDKAKQGWTTVEEALRIGSSEELEYDELF